MMRGYMLCLRLNDECITYIVTRTDDLTNPEEIVKEFGLDQGDDELADVYRRVKASSQYLKDLPGKRQSLNVQLSSAFD